MVGIVILAPLIVGVYYSEWTFEGNNIYLGFLIPSLLSISIGAILNFRYKLRRLTLVQGLLVTGVGWILISFICTFPFVLILDMSVINSFFEAVSGFTTTGITMITDLEVLPRSVLIFRSLIQWIGGLGIITFFLFIGTRGISEHILFQGESHKIEVSTPVPNVARTIKYLWIIYGGFTAALMGLLYLQGMSPFDTLNHAFTTLSTGGFSTYNSSIAHFGEAGIGNYKLIEYTITVFMFLGGTSFVVHYRVLKGRIKTLWDNIEMKTWWAILGFSTFFIMYEAGLFEGSVEPIFRKTLFQVVAVATTTGFETEFIGGPLFGAMARQLFLILMVIGSCVSSTGGGLKVRRVSIMLKGIWNRIKRASRPREMMSPLMVDGEKVENSELERIFIIFASWILILLLGGLLTALLSSKGSLTSFSGIFSALGNIGPSFMSVSEMAALNPIIKIFYIFAMLVGRLEILPVFILFNKEVWEA